MDGGVKKRGDENNINGGGGVRKNRSGKSRSSKLRNDKPHRGKKQSTGKRRTSSRGRTLQSKQSRSSRGSHKQARRASKKQHTIPETARLTSKKSKSLVRVKASRARSGMSLTELQFLAKSRGIPFGGLTKTKLIRKINDYY